MTAPQTPASAQTAVYCRALQWAVRTFGIASLGTAFIAVVFACGCNESPSLTASDTEQPHTSTATSPVRPEPAKATFDSEEAITPAKILSTLTTTRERVSLATAAATKAATEALPKPISSRKVVMVGDSMAFFLGRALKPMLEADGHEFKYLHKASDSLRAWRYQGARRMFEAMRKHKPDMVIVVLGTNDYWYPRVERLLPPVKKTLKAIGDKPCYWIGPPMWRPDTGIINLLAENTRPCEFYNSKPLTISRRPDGIHPSDAGSLAWARSIYWWMREHPPTKLPKERSQ